MALTQEEIQMCKNWCNGFMTAINSNEPNAKKKYSTELNNIIKKEEYICCKNSKYIYNNNNNCGLNYHHNSYSSNNVHITGNTNGGSVCSLF